MKATFAETLARLPGPAKGPWTDGAPFATALQHGSMIVELYLPGEHDLQTPHTRDELYFIIAGRGEFTQGSQRYTFAPGDVFFVPAGEEHRFESFSADFSTWVVFYGPEGGERS